MKSSTLILLFFLLVSALFAQKDYGHKPGYNLVWHDEFTDTVRSNQVWERIFPWGPMNTKNSYGKQTGNHVYRDGEVDLMIRKENHNGEIWNWDSAGNFYSTNRDFIYTDALMYSKAKFLHGYFETRFTSMPGKGFYNAFWMYGENAQEIDIFELAGSEPDDAQMTLHWKGKDPITNSEQSIAHLRAEQEFGETYHTFGVKWTSTDLDWYHNGKVVPQSNFTRSVRKRHIPNLPLNLIMNSSVDTYDGSPNQNTTFPGRISFDYIRAYQNEEVVIAPEIKSAPTITYLRYQPEVFPMELLEVKEHYRTYPYGFTYELGPGLHYSTDGKRITVENGYRESFQVPVRVNDGINWSEPFYVTYRMDPALGIENQSDEARNYHIYQEGPGLLRFAQQVPLNIRLELHSIDGKLLAQSETNQKEYLWVIPAIPQGMYLVSAVYNGQTLFQNKLVLQ